jgi:hypothetical protein
MTLPGERSATKALSPHLCLYYRLACQGGVVHGVDDYNTRHMSLISNFGCIGAFPLLWASRLSPLICPTYRTGVSQKSCRQHNVLGQSSEDYGTVKCRFRAATQSPIIFWVVVGVFYHAWRKS